MSKKYDLGYWGIRGLVQPIRYLIAYLQLDVNDIHYENRDDWFLRDKPAHEKLTNFPNLPYIKKGDEVITESWAILTYLCYEAERFDLLGSQPLETVKIVQIHGVISDART